MTNPIAGNQNFTTVENLAGQLKTLNAGVAKVGNLEVGGDVTAGGNVTAQALARVPNDRELVKVTLYTETADNTWWTAGAGNARSLVTGSHAGTTNFSFDAASTVVAASIRSTSAFASGGAATVQLGVAAADTAATDLFNLSPFTNLDAVGEQVDVSNGAGDTLGSTGAVAGVAAAASEQVTIHTLTAALTAGEAEVDVYYYVN